MLPQVVSGVLVAGSVALVLGLLRASAQQPACRDPETGDLVLKCGRGFVVMMLVIAGGGPVSMALLSLVIPFAYPAQAFVPVGIGAFFLAIGGPLALWGVKRGTRLSEDGITSYFVMSSPRFLAWEDVKKVSFASGQEFWLVGTKGDKAMIHVWFVGAAEAVPELWERLPEKVVEKYGDTIRFFGQCVGARG